MTLESVREEIRLAGRRIHQVIQWTSSRNWELAIETVGDEQERRVVGVQSYGGDMVMGDCMSNVNNEVTVGDARFVTLMGPGTAFYFSALLEKGADLAIDSPLFPIVHTAALEINRKWAEMEKALKGES